MSNNRLTDEQVADFASEAKVAWADITQQMAVELVERRRLDALRPDCPTCEGRGYDNKRVVHLSNDDQGTSSYANCAACADGKMPLDKWVALLVETLAAARSDMEGWAAYASDYFTAKHNLAGDLASVDAVLKMVPEAAEPRCATCPGYGVLIGCDGESEMRCPECGKQ